MPFTTLSHGTLQPIPSMSEAPYKVGQSITIKCFDSEKPSEHKCLWDGWDNETWPDCTPSGSQRLKGLQSLYSVFVLTLVLVFAG